MQNAPCHLYIAPVARCGCGRSYSRREWLHLEFKGFQEAPAGNDPVAEPAFTLELRDCPCGSTISAEVDANTAALKTLADEANRDAAAAIRAARNTTEMLFNALCGPVSS